MFLFLSISIACVVNSQQNPGRTGVFDVGMQHVVSFRRIVEDTINVHFRRAAQSFKVEPENLDFTEYLCDIGLKDAAICSFNSRVAVVKIKSAPMM